MKYAGLHAGYASLVGHIREGPVSIVAIKNVAAILGNKQVGKSIVVVIAPNATQAVTGPRNTSAVGHVRKSVVATVTIKRIAHRKATLIQIAAIHEVNVLPAIRVKVGHTDS